MSKLQAGFGLLLGGFLAIAGHQDPAPGPARRAVVVGIFDSRAVATAYVRSKAFNDYVGAQRADIGRALERAKAAGDTQLAADLEALGPAMQRRVHRQGFSTAPVDDVIARIEAELPGIAAKAGVDVIVSKWSLAWRRPDAQLVDVTDQLVAEFDPDEKTLEVIRDLVAKQPVPPGRLDAHK
jgi:hypothetical protein